MDEIFVQQCIAGGAANTKRELQKDSEGTRITLSRKRSSQWFGNQRELGSASNVDSIVKSQRFDENPGDEDEEKTAEGQEVLTNDNLDEISAKKRKIDKEVDQNTESEAAAVQNSLLEEKLKALENIAAANQLLGELKTTTAELQERKTKSTHICYAISQSDLIQHKLQYECNVSSLAGLKLIFKHSECECEQLLGLISDVERWTIKMKNASAKLLYHKNKIDKESKNEDISKYNQRLAAMQILCDELKNLGKQLMLSICTLMNHPVEIGYMLNASFVKEYNLKVANAVANGLEAIEGVRKLGYFVIKI